jgi:hypothetical protein
VKRLTSQESRKWSVSLLEITDKKVYCARGPIPHMGDEGADQVVPSPQFPNFMMLRSSPQFLPWDRLTCSYTRVCGWATHTLNMSLERWHTACENCRGMCFIPDRPSLPFSEHSLNSSSIAEFWYSNSMREGSFFFLVKIKHALMLLSIY